MNLLLADDHSVMRKGLKLLIQDFFSNAIIDEAADGDSAFHKIKIKDYDLAILDINMPNTDSLGLVKNILALKPAIKILMYSMNAEEAYAKRYLGLGVMGYVRKDEPESEIINAIRTVLNNRKYVSTHMSQKLLDDIGDNKDENPFDKLSAREFEIAQHLARGESAADIGNISMLHYSTIVMHKTRILEKLHCKNVFELNELARMYKIIPSS